MPITTEHHRSKVRLVRLNDVRHLLLPISDQRNLLGRSADRRLLCSHESFHRSSCRERCEEVRVTERQRLGCLVMGP